MTAEKDILLSLLKLTHNGWVPKKSIATDAGVPATLAAKTLRKISQENLFHDHENLIKVTPSQRVEIAIRAVQLGADSERVCLSLSWREFERITAHAFEANDYRAVRNFRFKQASKRWEIDILGFRKPLIICIDCKHWKHGWGRNATMKTVRSQIERTRALVDAPIAYYEKAGIEEWETATLVPMVLSLMTGPDKFYNNVPVVPVFQIQNFINELPSRVKSLKHFKKKLVKLDEFLTRKYQ